MARYRKPIRIAPFAAATLAASLFLAPLLLAGCGGAGPSASPTGAGTPSPGPSEPLPTGGSSPTDGPGPSATSPAGSPTPTSGAVPSGGTPIPTPAGSDTEFFVSPGGNDAWSGRLSSPDSQGTDGPLATLDRARALVRDIPASLGPATVWIRGGDYYLSAPVRFNALDRANTTYAAYPGETPVFHGSVPLAGWKEETYRGIRVWSLAVDPEKGERFNALYDGTGSLPVARYPASGTLSVRDALAEDMLTPGGAPYFCGNLSFEANPADLPDFGRVGDVRVRILHYWKDEMILLESVDPGTGHVRLTRPASMTIRKGDRYYFENVPAALDQPGEWCYDGVAGKVLYVPRAGETRDTKVLLAGRTEQFIVLGGTKSVRFRGLTFTGNEWKIPSGMKHGFIADNADHPQAAYDVAASILLNNTSGVVLENCNFLHIGGSALRIGRNVRDTAVTGCTFRQVGANAIFIHGENVQPSDPLVTRNLTIRNNRIEGYGRRFFNAIGILLIHARDCDISHNDIRDGFYTAISAGWTWGYGYNVTDGLSIRNNRIHDIGQSWLSDMGGIYTLGVQPGTVIAGNVISSIRADEGSGGYGGWGIYLDEGSSGILVENNLVYDCNSQGFHQHYGRDNLIRNNIFAFCGISLVALTRTEAHESFVLERNIFYSDRKPVYLKVRSVSFRDDSNLFWDHAYGAAVSCVAPPDAAGALRVADLREDESLSLCRQAVVADPGFRNAAGRDFRLADDSPALAAGFVPFDVAGAGLLGP